MFFAKTVAYGGDGMNQEWEDEMSKFLKSHQDSYGLMKGYGMTEMAGPVCTSNHKFPVMLPFFCNNTFSKRTEQDGFELEIWDT